MSEQQPEYEVQRWTAKRKTAVVLEVLRNQITGVEACRKYGIKQGLSPDLTDTSEKA